MRAPMLREWLATPHAGAVLGCLAVSFVVGVAALVLVVADTVRYRRYLAARRRRWP